MIGLLLAFGASAFIVAASFAVMVLEEKGSLMLPATPAIRFPTLPTARLLRLPAVPQLSCKRVGGLRFLKFGRLTVSWSISRKG